MKAAILALVAMCLVGCSDRDTYVYYPPGAAPGDSVIVAVDFRGCGKGLFRLWGVDGDSSAVLIDANLDRSEILHESINVNGFTSIVWRFWGQPRSFSGSAPVAPGTFRIACDP